MLGIDRGRRLQSSSGPAMTGLGACLLALVLFVSTGGVNAEDRTNLLIDDFSREDGRSALGTEWRAFTDRVMGGVSRGSASRDTLATLPCLRLRGEVSLENRGGFIQMALPLGGANGPLDAGGYRGFRITVTGNGRMYSIHLRTTDTRLPWQYYHAPIPTAEGWREIDVPFAAFRGESLRAPLDPTRLERVAIAAANWEGTADVAIARIALYR